MYYPPIEKALELAAEYQLIPIRMTFMADQETPISIFQRLRCNGSFLLESVEGGTRWARYSFIGLNPLLRLEAKNGEVRVQYRDRPPLYTAEHPIERLRQELQNLRSPDELDFPRFSGGAVGYFGYDILRYYEDLPEAASDDLKMDDVKFMFADEVIVFDHLKQEIQVIGHIQVGPEDKPLDIERKYKACCERIKALARRTRSTEMTSRDLYVLPTQYDPIEVQSNVTQEEFIQRVKRAKEYIASGDIFQVVLSQRFMIEDVPDPFHVYRVLRSLNPSPYMYFLQFSEEEILVGTSPELLVRVEEGKVENRPIAGTRQRGRDSKEDEQLKADLLADEKERAEHHMLVDLGRNDIGRVSAYGTVKVEQLMEIEMYSHVMHIVSHVTGRLQKEKDAFDALVSCFPAGTVSGAPKLRAMEIIAELENEARNAYAGAIGYFSFSGNMDSCITIRTIVFKDGRAYIQAGAGIVADSVPVKEFEETENKAKALIRAIQMAKQIQRLEEDEEYVSTTAQ
ncbi:anthranilate synthase component I [Ammoniphilus sp. CFH 90114]|uniref:anthranilate synthase component I n=1 Tax=Ammoniphilus sp. CFH 90114 TaxID=2493665 RepID=UPI00100FDD2B|nr:anthranilate synthase component I [Ammoniphilus sp. CFH 90114]RXT13912.1 anthranilate synthase component I [Ammoniphilus sp. CFH 90114]